VTECHKPPVDAQGFLASLLTRTPAFVVGFLSSILGTVVVVIAILKLGGMDVPFNRVANAHAASMEASVAKLDKSTERLEELVKRLERLDISEAKQNDTLLDHERRITSIESDARKARIAP